MVKWAMKEIIYILRAFIRLGISYLRRRCVADEEIGTHEGTSSSWTVVVASFGSLWSMDAITGKWEVGQTHFIFNGQAKQGE